LSQPPDCHDPLDLVQALLAVARRMNWLEERVQALETVNLELQERLRIAGELTGFVVDE
jgi:hypothetical protein